jgi:putative membrane protein (TIGR04086 family)
MTSTKIHWGRAFAGGLFAITVPVYLALGDHPLLYIVPPGALVTSFLGALWVGLKIESRFVLHGLLVGIVATLVYVLLAWGQPEPLAYIIAHGLKILGGMAGGIVAERRSNRGAPGFAAAGR